VCGDGADKVLALDREPDQLKRQIKDENLYTSAKILVSSRFSEETGSILKRNAKGGLVVALYASQA
jgi:hypothetical protein